MNMMPKNRYFTMIELVCIISIVGIFALLAAGAVQSSKKTICMDNEKKLGQILHQYAEDNQNFLPYPVGNDYRPPFSWVNTLHKQKYIPGANKDSYFQNQVKGGHKIKIYAVLSCPAAGPNTEDNIQKGWWCRKSGTSADYGINCYFSTSDGSGRLGNFSGRIKISDCRNPAASVLLADSNAKQFHLPYGDISTVERHEEQANLLMGDGSIRSCGEITEEQIRHGFTE